MTSAGFYKDRPAIRVDTGALTALFLPEDGGKLASLKARDGYEYLYQGPESRYRRLTVDGSYIEAECSGWDDMFPTIDPYQPEGLPPYPDHGEICRIPLEHIHAAGCPCATPCATTAGNPFPACGRLIVCCGRRMRRRSSPLTPPTRRSA